MALNKKLIYGIGGGLIGAAALIYVFTKPKSNQAQTVVTPPVTKCLNGQTEIYDYYKNAVVLVNHTYKFQVSIKGSEPFDVDLGEDAPLMERSIFGTGFFVSNDGKIMTNHHVAEPWKYSENDSDEMAYARERIATILPDSLVEVGDMKRFLETYWSASAAEIANATVGSSNANLSAADTVNGAVAEHLSYDENGVNYKTVNEDEIDIIPVTQNIKVALHGSSDTWLPATLLRSATDKDVDIALLQLTDKKIPATVNHIVDAQNAYVYDDSLKPGTKAILIGYPMGMVLAQTKKGIKVQSYEGQINKESDGTSLQYNITSTHGASGSPVFNECGKLIAINFAGFDQAQGYNFGIVAKHAKALLEQKE